MQNYIQDLACLILQSSSNNKHIRIDVQAENLDLDIDTATPLGLIINELITNSCKHAFHGDGDKGLIIVIKKQLDEFVLNYSETGVIQASSSNPDSNKGLGMILIKNLVKQLHGRMEINYSGGVKYSIWFSDKVKRKTIE